MYSFKANINFNYKIKEIPLVVYKTSQLCSDILNHTKTIYMFFIKILSSNWMEK